MKELEKTRRLSIAAVLSILALVIALVSYKRPENIFSKTSEDALVYISENDIFIDQNEITEDHFLLDIRNNFDFNRGHLNNSKNVYGPELFNEKNEAIFEALKSTEKVVVLIGENSDQTIPVFMTLYQLGLENLRIVNAKQFFEHNELIVQTESLEKQEQNIQEFIETSVKKAAAKKVKPKPVIVKPKKVIPKKKKKKMPIEGGC